MVKRTMASDTTENPAYGISPYWPYYCDCCSCCCDSESDSDTDSCSSTTTEESISLSCSSISSTTSSDDEDDKLSTNIRRSDISYEEIRKSEDNASTKGSCDFIRLELTDKRQPELTISTQLKMKDGSSECIQVQLSNVLLDEDSVVILTRSNSVGGDKKSPVERVSGRRKAGSWAGAQRKFQNDETTMVCRGRRDQKKFKLFSAAGDLAKVEEVCKSSEFQSDQSVGLPTSEKLRESNINQKISTDIKPKLRSTLFKAEHLTYFGNTMDTDENKLFKLDSENENKTTEVEKVTLREGNKGESGKTTSLKTAEAENIEKLLMQGSENNPANIPMVVMQSCQLHLLLNPASRDTIMVPMGTIINALYKYEGNLRVKTPHGDEGLLKFSNCAPLVSLPTAKIVTRRMRDSRIYKHTPLVNVPVIKPKALTNTSLKAKSSNGNRQLTPNIPKTRVLESRLKQVRDWDDSDVDKIKVQLASEPPDESQTLGLTLTEGPILVVACTYNSYGRSTLSVRQGELVTLLNNDLKDWLWVRASSGAEGFIPSSHVCSTPQPTR